MFEEVFRFLNVRPVQKITEKDITKKFAIYDVVEESTFVKALKGLNGKEAYQNAVDLSRQRLAMNDLNEKDLSILQNAVQKAIIENTVDDAKMVVEKVFGKTISAYLNSDEACKLKDSLWDCLYAHTIVPEEIPEQRERVYEGVRLFHFLELMMKQKGSEKPPSMEELSGIKAILPKDLIPELPLGDRSWEKRYIEQLVGELNQIYSKVIELNAAVEEIKNMDREFKVVKQRIYKNVKNVKKVINKLPSSLASEILHEGVETVQTKEVVMLQVSISTPKNAPWVFDEFGKKNLSKSTLVLLDNHKAILNELEPIEVVSKLESEKFKLVSGYLKSLPTEAVHYIYNNSQFQDIIKMVPVPGFDITPHFPVVPYPKPGTAATRGIKPIGIGDLMVVKQELERYEAGEVAHIENVLKSEFKTRTHNRITEQEEIIITESEKLDESEKDLQTTERFEMQKEAQKTIESNMSIQAGISVTAGYGPVSMTAHADFALNNSSVESKRTSSSFARQITEQTVSRIMQRTREIRTRRTLERIEEKNEHGFDNKLGTGHVTGIYRYVDKYYKASLINYGRRLMMEFIVPEPAAFYLYLQKLQSNIVGPKEPRINGKLLKPSDLTKDNYTEFVAIYNVQDVEPYPAEVVKVSAAFAEASGTSENVDYAKSAEKLTVPPGYKCWDIYGAFYYHGWHSSGLPAGADCLIAGEAFGVTSGYIGNEGVIPISVKGWMKAFHVNVTAICELKKETIEAWQLKTYAAIINAYKEELSNYNEQIAVGQIQAGIQIQGRTPDLNRIIERDELKKGALRLLTNNFAKTRVNGVWYFADELNKAMNSVNEGNLYPESNINEALIVGKIIQFFEQAFEWDNITYRFYPYFWGDKKKWKEIFPLTDNDPMFTDFLRAGAARVVIPVHPSYNEAVLHYLTTCEIWNGGDTPIIDDPLFISIINELKADSGANINDTLSTCNSDSRYPCLVEQWEVKIPTTLVYLQEDGKLPEFNA